MLCTLVFIVHTCTPAHTHTHAYTFLSFSFLMKCIHYIIYVCKHVLVCVLGCICVFSPMQYYSSYQRFTSIIISPQFFVQEPWRADSTRHSHRSAHTCTYFLFLIKCMCTNNLCACAFVYFPQCTVSPFSKSSSALKKNLLCFVQEPWRAEGIHYNSYWSAVCQLVETCRLCLGVPQSCGLFPSEHDFGMSNRSILNDWSY